EEELYACQRGCRLFSICQFVDDGIDLNRTKLECESACTEAYSQPDEQYACHLGCQDQLPFAELRQEQSPSVKMLHCAARVTHTEVFIHTQGFWINSGWILTTTLVLSVMVLLWICCAAVATAVEQYVPPEKLSIYGDLEFMNEQKLNRYPASSLVVVRSQTEDHEEAGPLPTKGESESNPAAGRQARPGGEGCGPFCCSRRGACLSAFLMLLLAMLASLLVVATVLGRPTRIPEPQSCVTMTNRTGFLCHDRSHCILAHRVCDGVRTCPHGEDEDESLCRDVPQSLPRFLLAHCGDPASWIYSDQKCDGTNNCGDCSDELSPGGGLGTVTVCPPCGPGWWRCTPTVFKYCGCIPRDLCRDHVQHCSDWSDEYACPGP
ncbi:hypothetical protein STEG23_026994, partial [Scotinomys teguina]